MPLSSALTVTAHSLFYFKSQCCIYMSASTKACYQGEARGRGGTGQKRSNSAQGFLGGEDSSPNPSPFFSHSFYSPQCQDVRKTHQVCVKSIFRRADHKAEDANTASFCGFPVECLVLQLKHACGRRGGVQKPKTIS